MMRAQLLLEIELDIVVMEVRLPQEIPASCRQPWESGESGRCAGSGNCYS
jgi:hypothetical protein